MNTQHTHTDTHTHLHTTHTIHTHITHIHTHPYHTPSQGIPHSNIYSSLTHTHPYTHHIHTYHTASTCTTYIDTYLHTYTHTHSYTHSQTLFTGSVGRYYGIEPSQAPCSVPGAHTLSSLRPSGHTLEVKLRLQGLDQGKPPRNEGLSSIAIPQTRSFLGANARSTLGFPAFL